MGEFQSVHVFDVEACGDVLTERIERICDELQVPHPISFTREGDRLQRRMHVWLMDEDGVEFARRVSGLPGWSTFTFPRLYCESELQAYGYRDLYGGESPPAWSPLSEHR